jgi:hypothetical protein
LNQDEIQQTLRELGDLAGKFRGAPDELKPGYIARYRAILSALLETGWRGDLEPEDELPDEYMPTAHLQPTIRPKDSLRLSLRSKLRSYDAMLADVKKVGGQEFSVRARTIYSRRFESPGSYERGPFTLIGGPCTWGNRILADGERAIIFVSYSVSGNRYYQMPWMGHLTVIEDDGRAHVLLHGASRPAGIQVEDEILRHAIEPTALPGAPLVIALDVFERYLLEEVAYLESPQSRRYEYLVRPAPGAGGSLLEFRGDHRAPDYPNVLALLEPALVDCSVSQAHEPASEHICWNIQYAGGKFQLIDELGGLFILPLSNPEKVLSDVTRVLSFSDKFTMVQLNSQPSGPAC